jgi:hypothetical protein
MLFSGSISALCRSSFCHIPDIKRIWSCLDHNTVVTTATCFIHYRLIPTLSFLIFQSVCLIVLNNSFSVPLMLTLSSKHQNSLVSHFFSKYLHLLKIIERIQFKILSLSYPKKFSKLINRRTLFNF